MLMRHKFQVGPMAAPQTISAVPRIAKNAVVTPKNPTKNGPTQKSNRSPPIRVPPLTRYFLSKLSIAIVRVSNRQVHRSGEEAVTDWAWPAAASATVAGHGYFAAGGNGAICAAVAP